MAEDHTGLNNGRFDEPAFLQQCRLVLAERERMMEYELARFKEGFFFCLFDTPDRLQHMLWRFREPGHPANLGGNPDPELARAIEEHYRECDRIVGRVLEHAGEQTLLMVLSDHGMNSFQRGVHLNTWLWERGLLALQNGSRPGDHGEFFRDVDWSRTQAYALGLGGIYLNREGREERGIVGEDEAAGLAARIASGLSELGDPDRGVPAIRSVVAREQVYSGPFAAEAPDLLVNFSGGYRVSWSSALGGVPQGLVEDNTKKWAGDHIIDPCLVPGVLFMNQAFQAEGATLADMAPTILAALGAEKASAMEGKSLLI
jgi:predicted AlkP superfamily phosphohydrolase/phosphomutase